jgi:DNA-binding transcriptional regulator YdaS (Cro superfamily)
MQALEKAIELTGGVGKLASAAGVRQSVISMARSRNSVSAKLAEKIEAATNGEVSKESLVWGDQNAKAA